MKTILKLLKPLKKFTLPYLIGIILVILFSFGRMYLPLIVKSLIDDDLRNFPKEALNFININQKIALYVGLSLVVSVVGYFGYVILSYVSTSIAAYLRNLAFFKMQKLPISYFDDKPAGKITTTIVNYTETLQNSFYYDLLVNFVTLFLNIAIVYWMAYELDVRLFLLFLLIIPIFIIWQFLWKKIIKKPLDDYYQVQSDINVQVNEMMNSADIIQLYGQTDNTIANFQKYTQKMLAADLKIDKLHSFLGYGLGDFFKRLFTFFILTYVGYHYLGGNVLLSIGNIFVAIKYSDTLFQSMNMLVQILPNIYRSLNTGERLLSLLDEKEEYDQNAKLTINSGEVEFIQVKFAYKEDVPVLKDISFKINAGEVAAFVGHTGSGKTSIMNLIYRFYDQQSGQILIDGQNILEYSRESVRSYMGIVLQDPYLFTGTIASNVRMGNKVLTDEEVEDYLRQVGAGPLIDRLPQGIHHAVMEKGKGLSSGERQLISFARTLASNPKIIILDEATSHIDTETEELIQAALKVLQKNRTTLIIAHRLSTIKDADKIFVLEKGKIIEQGQHTDLLAQNGTYAHMYNMQAGNI